MFQGSFSNADTGPQDYEEYSDSEPIDLHKACRIGDIAAIKQAFRAQPEKLNERDSSVRTTQLGWAPLYRTVICGHVQAVEFLLKQGAEPDVVNNVLVTQLGETPLHQAADNSQLTIAELLLQHRANPNVQQNDGDTPLHHASFRGDLDMVELLLRYKADPNVPNFMLARTPFHYAVSGGHLDCVQMLLLHGADIDTVDKQQKTIFDMAGTTEMQQAIMQVCKDAPQEFEEESSHEAVGRVNNQMLSPISEVISFNQSDVEEDQDLELNVNLHISPPRTDRIDTFGGTPKKQLQPPEPDSERTVAKYLAPVLKPLYEWLERENLQDLYEVLVDAGYDDVEEMVEQMRSPLPITETSLRNIGVSKPGHCSRLLMRLEEECGMTPKFTRPKSASSHRSKSFLHCCTAPNNATFGLLASPSLLEWLKQLSLEQLFDNFKDAGYDDYESLVSQMSWRKPITEEVLERDMKIMKPGHRVRIISKLKEDAVNRNRGETSPGLVLESGGKLVACETCSAM